MEFVGIRIILKVVLFSSLCIFVLDLNLKIDAQLVLSAAELNAQIITHAVIFKTNEDNRDT